MSCLKHPLQLWNAQRFSGVKLGSARGTLLLVKSPDRAGGEVYKHELTCITSEGIFEVPQVSALSFQRDCRVSGVCLELY